MRAENRSTQGETSRNREPTNSTHSLLTALIFSINDLSSHKLLALVSWFSANHDNINWMITRGNTNWTTWPSQVGDNRTECSISFISFIYSFNKISGSTRVAFSWSRVTCVYSPLSLADIADYSRYIRNVTILNPFSSLWQNQHRAITWQMNEQAKKIGQLARYLMKKPGYVRANNLQFFAIPRLEWFSKQQWAKSSGLVSLHE